LCEAYADPQGPCDFHLPDSLGSQLANTILERCVCPRAAQFLPLARPAFTRSLDDGSLELGEHAQHSEHCFAGRRGRIEGLLVEVQIDAFRLQVAEESDKVLKAPTKPVHRPRSDHIELSAGDRSSSASNCARAFRPLAPLMP
jgi:hypothetical protein